MIKRKPHSEETKKKIGLANAISLKGRIPKNIIDGSLAKFNRNRTYAPFSEEWKRKIGLSSKGRHSVKEFKKGMIPWNKGIKWEDMRGEKHPMFGKHHSLESLKKITIANRKNALTLEKHWNWQGGISKDSNYGSLMAEKRRLRILGIGGIIIQKEWKELKDFYQNKCIGCNKSEDELGKKLTMDHIIPVSMGGQHSINNIQPLCKSCNCKKHKRSFDYRPQWIEKHRSKECFVN